MKLQFGIIGMIFAVCILLAPSQIEAARLTEYLDRGVVAVRVINIEHDTIRFYEVFNFSRI